MRRVRKPSLLNACSATSIAPASTGVTDAQRISAWASGIGSVRVRASMMSRSSRVRGGAKEAKTGESMSEVAPVREESRIKSLDVMRGFAVLGILVVNAAYFAAPWQTGLNPALPPLAVNEDTLWS